MKIICGIFFRKYEYKSHPGTQNNCQDLSVFQIVLYLGLEKCYRIPNCITKKILLILPEIFKGYAGRYGEHYCELSLQTNECEKRYCVLCNNCLQHIFVKKLCNLSLDKRFDGKRHTSKVFYFYLFICL